MLQLIAVIGAFTLGFLLCSLLTADAAADAVDEPVETRGPAGAIELARG